MESPTAAKLPAAVDGGNEKKKPQRFIFMHPPPQPPPPPSGTQFYPTPILPFPPVHTAHLQQQFVWGPPTFNPFPRNKQTTTKPRVLQKSSDNEETAHVVAACKRVTAEKDAQHNKTNDDENEEKPKKKRGGRCQGDLNWTVEEMAALNAAVGELGMDRWESIVEALTQSGFSRRQPSSLKKRFSEMSSGGAVAANKQRKNATLVPIFQKARELMKEHQLAEQNRQADIKKRDIDSLEEESNNKQDGPSRPSRKRKSKTKKQKLGERVEALLGVIGEGIRKLAPDDSEDDQRYSELERRVDRLENKLEKMAAEMGRVSRGMEEILSRLNGE